jgi:hypothetical protein
MATTNKAIQEQMEVLVEVETCDQCGAPATESNPVELRTMGGFGQAAFVEEGPPEYWMQCAACRDEEVIF